MNISRSASSLRERGAGRRRARSGRVCLVGGLAAVALTAAGCASGSSGSSGSSASVNGPVSGSLSIAVLDFSYPTVKPVVAAFEKKYPKVHVSIQNISSSGDIYPTTLLTEKLGGGLPDIVEQYDSLSPVLEAKGIVADLSPYLKKGEPYPQNYWLPNIMASYIPPDGPDQGKVYALPGEADATVMYYNKNEFKAAGVPVPTDNWTWAQMIADAKKLAVKKGGTQTRWGLCLRPQWKAFFDPMLRAYGATSFNSQRADLASAGALQAWKTMITPLQDGTAVPFSTMMSAGGTCDSLFTSGQTAMALAVRADLPTIRAGAAGSFDFDVVPIPYVNGVKGPVRPTGAGSTGWSISTQVKNAPAAMAFLHYMFSPAGQEIGENTYGVLPAVTSLVGSNGSWSKLPGPPYNNAAFTTAAKDGLIVPQIPGTVFNLVLTAFPKAIEQVLAGQSYQQAFSALNTQMNAAYPQSG